MKAKLLAALLALTLTVCSFLPALAEEAAVPVFNEEMQLLKQANDALRDTYGLSLAVLGLFDAEVSLCGEAAVVVYTPSGGVPDALAGDYFVIISNDEAQVLWSHGSVDPAVWQSGELTSPVWGEKQLQAYLAAGPEGRFDYILTYTPAVIGPYDRIALEAAGGSMHPVTADNRAEADAASTLALAALQAMYGLTDEEAARLTRVSEMTQLNRYADGSGKWYVMFSGEPGAEELSYYVTLDADSGLILQVGLVSGGVG